MNSRTKTFLPNCFLIVIIFHLLWALWGEFRLDGLLYNAGVFFLFALMVSHFINNSWSRTLVLEIVFLVGWCVLMFWAYDNADYSYVAKKVSFFGLRVDSHARIMIYTFLLLVPGAIFSDAIKYIENRSIRIIIAAIVLTSLAFSVRAVIVFPDALRARSTTEYMGFEQILYGTPTYAIVYSFALIVPWFLAKWKNAKGQNKVYYFLMFTSVCVIVVISQFATALLAMLLGILAFWFMSSDKYDSGSAFSRFAVAGILILVLLIRTPIANLFSSLSESVSGTWAEKLEELAQFISGDGATGDLAARLSYYTDSLTIFGNSPLFGMLFSGMADGEVGGHASLLDMLALTGAVGTFLFIGAVYSARKRMNSTVNDKVNYAAINAITITYVFLLFTKNIITALAVNFSFFVLLPILFSMKESSDDEYI